jgi:choline dehydrogenase-like flavoprotein
VTRSGGLDPHWVLVPDPLNQKRGLKRIDLTRTQPAVDASNDLWIDRARVFQAAMDRLVKQGKSGSADYGTVDSSINDFDPANPANQFGTNGKGANYCERQGRCNVGCLPGARHTLNKQLMTAALGKPDGTPPLLPNLTVRALSEVDVVRAVGNGYAVDYDQYDPQSLINPGRKTRRTVTADTVIMAAGCLGTSQIMLRSKQRRDALPDLSDEVGAGFSTNGDYIAFLEKTRQRVSLTRRASIPSRIKGFLRRWHRLSAWASRWSVRSRKGETKSCSRCGRSCAGSSHRADGTWEVSCAITVNDRIRSGPRTRSWRG